MRRSLAIGILSLSILSTAAVAQTVEDFATAADFGRRFFEAGNYAASLTWFDKAESIVHDQPAILFNSALVLVRLQRYDESQRRLDRYLLLYPQGQEIQLAKALQRELQFGIEVRRREQQENEYRTMFSRARALADKNLKREALDAFQEAEKLYADDPALYYDEAVLNEADGNLENALRLFNHYVQTSPASAPSMQPHLIDLEREIGYTRTKFLCPFCGAVLPAAARWCHRCWHGPYDVRSAGWNAEACDAHITASRTFLDPSGKVRTSEPVGCAYPGATLQSYLRYAPAQKVAVHEARIAEGWTFSKDGMLESLHSSSGFELALHQGDYLQRVDQVSTGKVFEYQAHATPDGIWLLDVQPFTAGGQLFLIARTFDSDGHVQREDVTYESTACQHVVAMSATYTYSGDTATAVRLTGGYDGYRVEGSPQVRWDASATRTIDANGRLTREELAVTSYQKTWTEKPQGSVSDQVRRYYTSLKTRKPTDIRAMGDICGSSVGQYLEEPIDLRPFFTVFPALAVRLAKGDARITVDYAYSEK